jgi:acetyl-CoA carboxylase biotin carboxyl carrier protein
MKLVEQSSFDELTLEMDGIKLTLRRGAGVVTNGAGGAPLVDAGLGAAGSGGSATHAPVGAASASASHAMGSGSAAGGPHAMGSGSAAAGAAGSPPAAAQAANTGSAAPASAGLGATAARGAPAGATPATAAVGAAQAVDPNVHDVPAPLLGTFYRAPKPGAPPFIEVGSTVEEDTVVAIIEVMKLMNTVRAGVRGTVTEILARDGVLVEYGETLLRVRKAG